MVSSLGATSFDVKYEQFSRNPAGRLRDIHTSFGSIRAVRGVSLTVQAGEIVSIVGDNGAGKSTLIKIMTGVLTADEGTILVDGEQVTISKPQDAQKRGIAAIYQDLALFDNLDVGENVFAGARQLSQCSACVSAAQAPGPCRPPGRRRPRDSNTPLVQAVARLAVRRSASDDRRRPRDRDERTCADSG